ncbi:hypothetical protein HY502_00700 [Candidatus Woesebacteria bacterium]|nr:hypothetical protein [Candidatus Woesebacteria bacterium]
MNSNEIQSTYLDFFKSKGHLEVDPSPLILKDDPTTLFTSSGMQQLVPFLKGKKHPLGKRLVDSQSCLRMQDIEEIGDNRHTTFFNMLGNWSLGDYFKEEQLPWCWDFYTKELSLDPERLHITVFEGTKDVSKDNESLEIWKKIGVDESKIHFYGVDKNWWSRTGPPDEMPEGEIGGPSSEVFFEFDTPHDPKYGAFCHPNCDCGKFVEVGNSVFIEYEKKSEGLIALSQKNVDFGGGLERISVAMTGKPDIFEIDLLSPVVKNIETETQTSYGSNEKKDRSIRIVADHIRAALNLLAEGIIPSNKLQGYALRRLIRRSMFHLHLLGGGVSGAGLAHIGESLGEFCPQISKNWDFINTQLLEEGKKFSDALKRGLEKLRKEVGDKGSIDGDFAFDLYQSEGFPLELTAEILKESKVEFPEEARRLFEKKLEEHRNISQSKSSKLFKKS